MTQVGRRNIYTCEACAGQIVTVDLVEGVTPFMLDCKATAHCHGMMESAFYDVDQGLVPSHEWYRPEGDELAMLSHAMREHVDHGGLEIREISREPERAR